MYSWTLYYNGLNNKPQYLLLIYLWLQGQTKTYDLLSTKVSSEILGVTKGATKRFL